jgi:serine O-acetyltransferase
MIRSKADLAEHLAGDLKERGLHTWRPQYRITRRTLYFQWLLRRCEYWENCRPDPIGRLVALVLRFRLHMLGERLGFTVPRHSIGPGLHLPHHGTITISNQAQIGSQCGIHQGVTIGERAGGAPTLGDRVFIGANACLLGPITIGSGASIGAGAVVVHDVDVGQSVVGNPARPISPRDSARRSGDPDSPP